MDKARLRAALDSQGAYHSSSGPAHRGEVLVYHRSELCPDGLRISEENLRTGRGLRHKLCETCDAILQASQIEHCGANQAVRASMYVVNVNKTHQYAKLHHRDCQNPNCQPKEKTAAKGTWVDVDSKAEAERSANHWEVTLNMCRAKGCLCEKIG